MRISKQEQKQHLLGVPAFTNAAASSPAGTQAGQWLYSGQDYKRLAKTNHKTPGGFQSTIQTGTCSFPLRAEP